jgi:hypothetical protein
MKQGGPNQSKWLLPIAALAMLFAAAPAMAQPTEQAVKAAFLPKFARYVSWPPASRPAAGSPIQLCIIGTDSFGRLVDQAAVGQSVEQHPITIRRIASPEQAAGCHVAFVNGGNDKSTAAMLAALQTRPVLTVTDGETRVARGMIHFTLHQGRVRFYVNAAAAAQAKLTIDARLLGIALGVKAKQS